MTHDERAVYDYNLMIEWLVKEKGFTEEEAVEWIDYNTIGVLPYGDSDTPVVLYPFME